MTLAEAIYQSSRDLPEAAAREVLDFIEFIKQRHATETGNQPDDARLAGLTPEQREALAYLDSNRIDWNGKPIPDRDALYDDARG